MKIHYVHFFQMLSLNFKHIDFLNFLKISVIQLKYGNPSFPNIPKSISFKICVNIKCLIWNSCCFCFLKCFVSFQACASKFVKVHNLLLFFLFNNIPLFLHPHIILTKIIHFLCLSAQFPSRSPQQAEACGSQDACRESWRPWDGVACHSWTRLLGCWFSSLCCLCSYLLDQDMWGSNRPLNSRWT